MKLHQKGFLLVELSRVPSIWDDELIARAMAEYRLSGSYWFNSLFIALDELAAAGLIVRLKERLNVNTLTSHGKVSFHYRLSDFGRARMQDTGLLPMNEAGA